ncbi:MAG: succinic semialdehyde dehydrogenase, partial [Acidobacteriota bacterium]
MSMPLSTPVAERELEVRNPATGERVGSVPIASPADVEAAVARARAAQTQWANQSVTERAALLRRYHDLVLDRSDDILDTIQKESGKARRDALLDVLSVAGTARYYAVRGKRFLAGHRGRAAAFGITSARVVYKPFGVVGIISPWNFPFLLAIGDALPALLAGNAVVLKPSELTPLSAELGRRLLLECGLDADLFQVVQGRGEVGSELIRHVDYIGFTGGTATGRKVALAASERLIPFSLELGGKNPMIVLDGAPVEKAAMGLIAGGYNNTGQTCIAIERVYVQDSVYEPFVKAAAARIKGLKLGYSSGFDLDMGSLISEAHAAKVSGHIDDAVAKGAEVLAGGHRRSDLGPAFVEPTLLAGVTPSMKMFKDETFGPVVAVYRVRDADEAVRLANDSDYGLNASVWGGDGRVVREVSRRLETGSTGINSTLVIYHSFDVPMGGVKASGLGRRHGRHGILRYTQEQSIVRSTTVG